MSGTSEEEHRSGFACFVGRPNAGKSTLMNAMVGQKVAITSSRPQTTRHTIRGIVHRPDAQLVLVDTPGLHRPRTLLGQRLNDLVRTTWAEVDVVGFCIPADEEVGRGDAFIAREVASLGTPVIGIVTKIDRVGRTRWRRSSWPYRSCSTLPRSCRCQRCAMSRWTCCRPAGGFASGGSGAVPRASSPTSQNRCSCRAHPRGRARRVREELPHSLAVTVEEMLPRSDRLDRTHANIYVERRARRPSSSAPRVTIARGRYDARQHIEALLGTPVFLDLRVKVATDWQRDPKQLRRLGF